MTEVWKAIPGFEGCYEVSNLGRVRSLKRNTTSGGLIKTFINKGYVYAHLSRNGKHYNCKVHRAVASAFIDNPFNKPEVNHIDENKENNRVDNLEWVTTKENYNHGTRIERIAQKNRRPVVQMTLDGDVVRIWESSVAVEKETGMRSSNIRSVCCGIVKTAYGYKWKHTEECMDTYKRMIFVD
jgi:hypothetical protein